MPRPKIGQRPAMTVATISGVGNATTEVPRLVPALYKAVYGSKRLHGKEFKPLGKLRGRYFYSGLDTLEEDRHFKLALPVAEDTTQLVQAVPDITVEVEQWPAETVIEATHTGPYETEPATIELLHAYAEAQGYSITGPHEEEYLTDPDTPPERSKTIIRYAVTSHER